jgi:very-short-patch-repair endonuclease
MQSKLNRPATSALMAQRAHAFRAQLTPSEQKLWAELRGGRLGVQFRRQVVVGSRFIADFLAPAARLIIEVDGGYHEQRQHADARRDRVLARLGYRVLRLEAALVMRSVPEAVVRIRAALAR